MWVAKNVVSDGVSAQTVCCRENTDLLHSAVGIIIHRVKNQRLRGHLWSSKSA